MLREKKMSKFDTMDKAAVDKLIEVVNDIIDAKRSIQEGRHDVAETRLEAAKNEITQVLSYVKCKQGVEKFGSM